jgi:hypothetical protein
MNGMLMKNQSHEPAPLQPVIMIRIPPPNLSKPVPEPHIHPLATALEQDDDAYFYPEDGDELAPPASQIPIDRFFSQRPGFRYDPSQDTMAQFQKMKQEHLQPHEVRYEHRRFYDSIAEAFNASFGTDVNSLEGWHKLCELIGCWNIPNNVWACQRVSNQP